MLTLAILLTAVVAWVVLSFPLAVAVGRAFQAGHRDEAPTPEPSVGAVRADDLAA